MKLREIASGIILVFMVFSWFCIAANDEYSEGGAVKADNAQAEAVKWVVEGSQ